MKELGILLDKGWEVRFVTVDMVGDNGFSPKVMWEGKLGGLHMFSKEGFVSGEGALNDFVIKAGEMSGGMDDIQLV